jgi:hypothetical protein
MTSLKAFVVAVVLGAVMFSTGCTVAMGERSLTVSSAANPGSRETVPQTSGASLAYDDHPSRGR